MHWTYRVPQSLSIFLSWQSSSNHILKNWRNLYTLTSLQTFLVSLLKNCNYISIAQYLFFYWMLAFLKEKDETFIKCLAFLRVAFSVLRGYCTLWDTCKTLKKRDLRTYIFLRPLMVGLNCMSSTSAEFMSWLKTCFRDDNLLFCLFTII